MCAPPADALRPVYERSGGRDGFVSFECTPDLVDDTEATIAQALDLWERLGAANVMIKVPATEAGLGAIEQLTRLGSTSTSRCCSPSSVTTR
jgi:transaldolase